jgi:arginine deiminase
MVIEDNQITKYIFSGHDSFQCRQLWLKKGYDFVVEGENFNDEDSVVKLGVGKNMVSSIRFWLKVFNIIDTKDIPTEFGKRLFDDENGYDPFLEDEASVWLLHYQLVKNGLASIYSIIFNEFRKEKLFFDKETFVNYVRRISESNSDFNFNENTVAKDFIVFANLYKNDPESSEVEDSFSGVLSELLLLKMIFKTYKDENGKTKKKEEYFIENTERDNLPEAIVLFTILDNPTYGNSISLNSLEFDINSPGSIFALNRSGLTNKISEIVSNFKNITFTDQAGIKELQFKKKEDVYTILDQYYGK